MVDILSFKVPTPYPVGPVNLYLIRAGDVNVLVDTGPNTPEARQSLEKNFQNLGLSIEDMQFIIVTHAHQDHMGLAGWIKEQSGARICTHVRNMYWLTDYKGEWERQRNYFFNFWKKNGVPDEIIQKMNIYWNFFKEHSISTSVDCYVEKDSLFMVGTKEIEIIYTPGHATGHISLKVEDRFISGDHLLLDITSNPVIEPPLPEESERPMSLPMYIESLERTLEIKGIEEVYPGHGEPFINYKKVITTRIKHYMNRKKTVYKAMKSKPMTLYEICKSIFPDLPDNQRFLALSETQGHLDLLLVEGKVSIEEKDGIMYYVKQ